MLWLEAIVALGQVGVIIGIIGALVAAVFTLLRFAPERRTARFQEEDFYQRMYQGMNEALSREVARLTRENDKLQAENEKLESKNKE